MFRSYTNRARLFSIEIPLPPWRELLEQNRGGRIAFDVYVRRAVGPVIPSSAWTSPGKRSIRISSIGSWGP
jgi:hypothetical protein